MNHETITVHVTELGRHVVAPVHWSYTAVRIFADKFLHHQDEGSIVNALRRVAKFVSDGDVALENVIYNGMFQQRFAFNSPVFFNAGIEDKPQCSACFIQSVDDNMGSILDLAVKEGLLFRYGSGSGTNLSPIRSSNSSLSGGGKPSGPVSFMRGYDAFAGVIKSGGKTRRAAKMQILDADHDDINEFIWAKAKEERKARDLVLKAGYDADFNGDAYSSIFFQNSNLSVRMLGEYEEATDHDMQVLREIAAAAWECGDPGLQFADAINNMNPCANEEEIVASNPCSEFLFLNETSCNLASLNLAKYVLEDRFDISLLADDVTNLIRSMDNIVDLAGYPTREIEEKTKRFRPLGLGYTNLAHVLATFGLDYDTNDGRDMAAAITALMHAVALRASRDLAYARGTYPGWNGHTCSVVMEKFRYDVANLRNDLKRSIPAALWDQAQYELDAVCADTPVRMRNAQVTAIAPTGTISFIMDASTTGIEPPYARNITKKLVGGGEIVTTQYGSSVRTAMEISPQAHLDMVIACQPFVSGGISKTINMPNDATVDDILRIYQDAWCRGAKAVSVYRDGCKLSQPLVDADKKLALNAPVHGRAARQPLPSVRPAITHRFSVGEHDGYITVGMYDDGRPGEIFVQISKEGSTISGLLDAWAITASIALQHGTPLDAILDKLAYTRFDPCGFTGNPDVPMAHSIVDYLARWLLLRFDSGSKSTSIAPQQQHAPCPDCGGMMVRTGTCYSCPACGNHGGCG